MKNIHGSLTHKPNSTGDGQVMIEFALVLPVIVLVLLGVMDLARAVYAYGVISNAARDAAHWGSLRPLLAVPVKDIEHGDMDMEAVKQKAISNAKTLDESRIEAFPNCLPNWDSPYMDPYRTLPEDKKAAAAETHKCDSWNFVEVEVRYPFQPITLFFVPIKLTAKSQMTIE